MYTRKSRLYVILTLNLFLALACTLIPSQEDAIALAKETLEAEQTQLASVPQAAPTLDSQPSPTPTIPSTPTTPPTPTSTTYIPLPPSHTPTSTYNWNGTWSVWFIAVGPFPMTVSQTGNSIAASFTGGGSDWILEGTVSTDGRTVTGTIRNPGQPVWSNFTWKMKKNMNQFIGNVDIQPNHPMCGARNGASGPQPCYGP